MLMTTPLTRKQRDLTRELDEIVRLVGWDYQNAHVIEDKFERTAYLDLIKRQIIAAEVIQRYVFYDEFLNMAISRYYFGTARSFPQLWRTKRFQRFQHYLVERLAFVQKLSLADELLNIPKQHSKYMRHLNDLRNAFAHAFFPENLKGQRIEYRSQSLYTLNGFTDWLRDGQDVSEYFYKRLYGIHVDAKAAAP
jgi:hypothetical protein